MKNNTLTVHFADSFVQISAPVSALYISFGWQGWTALFDLVDTAGPKSSIKDNTSISIR